MAHFLKTLEDIQIHLINSLLSFTHSSILPSTHLLPPSRSYTLALLQKKVNKLESVRKCNYKSIQDLY